MIRNLLFVILSITFVSGLPVGEITNCDDMVVTVDIRPSRNNASIVTLKVKGVKGPPHYVFYRENGALLTNEFKSNRLSISEKGTFYYAVVGADGCKVISEFNIE